MRRFGLQRRDPQVWYTDPVLDLARYACVYTPNTNKPVPLVIYLPGSEADVSTLYTDTNLRAAAAVDGFMLAGVQGFNTHEFSGGLDGGADAGGAGLPDGQHLDSFYRDATPGGCNNDIRFIDWLVDDLVSGGGVDPKQIYVTGWSNGAFFAEWYALERYATATPGGNYVAAAAVYAGADPWGNIEDTGCGQAAQYPTFPGVPIQLVHRTCDALVPCMLQPTYPVTNIEDWMTTLATKVGDTDGDDVMVTAVPADVLAQPPVCMPYCSDDGGDAGTGSTCCSETLGLADHLTWPALQRPACSASSSATPTPEPSRSLHRALLAALPPRRLRPEEPGLRRRRPQRVARLVPLKRQDRGGGGGVGPHLHDAPGGPRGVDPVDRAHELVPAHAEQRRVGGVPWNASAPPSARPSQGTKSSSIPRLRCVPFPEAA